MAVGTKDATLKPLKYQKINPTTATAINLTNATGATAALIKTETQPVRWRDDGTDPTGTDGMLIDTGDEFWYSGNLKAIKFIDTAAGASTVHISLYR